MRFLFHRLLTTIASLNKDVLDLGRFPTSALCVLVLVHNMDVTLALGRIQVRQSAWASSLVKEAPVEAFHWQMSE
jgi:hypothetical protein